MKVIAVGDPVPIDAQCGLVGAVSELSLDELHGGPAGQHVRGVGVAKAVEGEALRQALCFDQGIPETVSKVTGIEGEAFAVRED